MTERSGADLDIVVVEDHPIFRDGLCRLMEATEGVRLAAGAARLEDVDPEVFAEVAVALLDLHLPGRSGPGAVSWVRDRGPAVLVLSAAGTRDDVLDAVAAGAGGYVTKDAEPAEVLHAIRVVAGGESYVSPALASFLLAAEAEPGPADASVELTAREREVLTLLAQGERDKDIAEDLFISVRTVRSHLDRIRDKTGRRRRPDLTRLAIEQGMTDPS